MHPYIKKAIRNATVGYIMTCSFSFVYGGIINEMIIEKSTEFSTYNLGLALFGAMFISVFIAIPVFVISMIVYYLLKKF